MSAIKRNPVVTELRFDDKTVAIDPAAETFKDEASDRESECGYVALRHIVAVTFEPKPNFFSNTAIEAALIEGLDLDESEISSWKAGTLYEKHFSKYKGIHVTVLDCENDNRVYSFNMKGKLEEVLSRCSTKYVDGKSIALTEDDKKAIMQISENHMGKVFGFADRTQGIDEDWEVVKEGFISKRHSIPFSDWRWIGLVCVADK